MSKSIFISNKSYLEENYTDYDVLLNNIRKKDFKIVHYDNIDSQIKSRLIEESDIFIYVNDAISSSSTHLCMELDFAIHLRKARNKIILQKDMIKPYIYIIAKKRDKLLETIEITNGKHVNIIDDFKDIVL